MKSKAGIFPTLACADYLDLRNQIDIMDRAKVASYHIDIMDGNFVPNYCLNFDYLRAVSSYTDTPCDVHLMTGRLNATSGQVWNAEQLLSRFTASALILISLHCCG